MNKQDIIIQIKNFVAANLSTIFPPGAKPYRIYVLTTCGLITGDVLLLDELKRISIPNKSNPNLTVINPFGYMFTEANATEEIYESILPLKNVEIFCNNTVAKIQYLVIFHDQITGISAGF